MLRLALRGGLPADAEVRVVIDASSSWIAAALAVLAVAVLGSTSSRSSVGILALVGDTLAVVGRIGHATVAWKAVTSAATVTGILTNLEISGLWLRCGTSAIRWFGRTGRGRSWLGGGRH